MKKTLVTLALALLVALCLTPLASADPIVLSSGNSTALIDPTSDAGIYQWLIDGRSFLFQQWFWYRIGSANDGALDKSIDTISAPLVQQLSPAIVDLTYSNAEVSVSVLYILEGGLPGSATADIAETITINNIGRSNLDFHFFQYSDFDLGGTPLDDTVQLMNANTVRQTDPSSNLAETVATPPPNRYELNFFANTLTKLNTTGADLASLNNGVPASLGPGDVTWAFQWDQVISPGHSLIISKDKHAEFVPEPGTMLLFGGALLFLSTLGARKLRKTR